MNYCRVDILTLDIERLQRSLPHLRTLNMGYILASSIIIEERPSVSLFLYYLMLTNVLFCLWFWYVITFSAHGYL